MFFTILNNFKTFNFVLILKHTLIIVKIKDFILLCTGDVKKITKHIECALYILQPNGFAKQLLKPL